MADELGIIVSDMDLSCASNLNKEKKVCISYDFGKIKLC